MHKTLPCLSKPVARSEIQAFFAPDVAAAAAALCRHGFAVCAPGVRESGFKLSYCYMASIISEQSKARILPQGDVAWQGWLLCDSGFNLGCGGDFLGMWGRLSRLFIACFYG